MAQQSPEGPISVPGGSLRMASGPSDLHPIAAIHRGRGGGRSGRTERRRTSLRDQNVDTVLKPGWLPEPSDLPEGDDIKFIGLDELRSEQSRHLEQVRAARQAVADLQDKYESEDAEHRLALKVAFDEGNDAPADQRTPQGKRGSALVRARESLDAAVAASIGWAEGALDRSRSLAPDWENAVDKSHSRLNSEIEQLQNQIAELRSEQRSDQRLITWLRRINAPTAGVHLAFSSTGAGVLPMDNQVPRAPGYVSIAPPGLPPEDTEQTNPGAA